MLNKLNTNFKTQKLIICIIITTVTLIVYWQVHQYGFVNIDDNIYVTENIHIQAGITKDSIRWAFSTAYAELWHPLIWLSLMLDYQLYGLAPGGYHFTNLILHILSTLLLFWLFCRMTKQILPSAFVAAFFALHPLHVESVAWVSERKDVLSAFFWMLTLSLYVHYTEKPAIRRYLLVLFSFALALMSKPMVVTLPVIMVLLDYWPLKRFESKNVNPFLWQVKEKAPFFILSTFFSIMTICAHHNRAIEKFSFNSRINNALVSFVVYLKKTFLPYDLAVYYPFPMQITFLQVSAAIIVILLISVVAIATIKRLPYLFVGWLWYSITILPVIGILQDSDQAMADRYHYLPAIGIAAMIAWGIPVLIKSKNICKIFLLPVAIVFLSTISVLTWKQCGHWQDSISISKHTLQVTKNNSMAHKCFADALFAANKTKKAIDHYSEAIRIKPGNVLIYYNRGLAYARVGYYRQALEDLDKVTALRPDYASAYYSRAIIYQGLNQYQPAIKDLSKAISIEPNNAVLYFNRGNSHISLSQYQSAIGDFNKAISLDPAYFNAFNNRGFIYLKFGHYQKAVEDYNKVIALKPDDANAYNNRAFVYLSTGNIEFGCVDARKACKMGICETFEIAKAKGYCR